MTSRASDGQHSATAHTTADRGSGGAREGAGGAGSTGVGRWSYWEGAPAGRRARRQRRRAPPTRSARTPRRAAARPLAGAAPLSPESLLQRPSCRLSRRRPWAWSVATGGMGKSATARGGGQRVVSPPTRSAAAGGTAAPSQQARRDKTRNTQSATLSEPKAPPPPPSPLHQHRGSGARWGKTPRPREPAILAIAPHDTRAVQAARGELRQSLQRGHRGGCRHLCSLRGAPSVSKAGWLVSG